MREENVLPTAQTRKKKAKVLVRGDVRTFTVLYVCIGGIVATPLFLLAKLFYSSRDARDNPIMII